MTIEKGYSTIVVDLITKQLTSFSTNFRIMFRRARCSSVGAKRLESPDAVEKDRMAFGAKRRSIMMVVSITEKNKEK
jgi:hypothetical protein